MGPPNLRVSRGSAGIPPADPTAGAGEEAGNMNQVKRNVREELGATAVEYALMAGLIAVVIAAAVGVVGTTLIPMFTDAANGLVGS